MCGTHLNSPFPPQVTCIYPWPNVPVNLTCACECRLLGCFLSQLLSCSNFYMLPFCSPCHAISKTVFIFTLAFLFLMWVLLAQNGHFYNVNLAQNLKTVITFYWNVRLSWYQHGWVCIYVLFPWIPIMGILVKPLVMAIWPIYGHFGHFGHIWPIWQWLMA